MNSKKEHRILASHLVTNLPLLWLYKGTRPADCNNINQYFLFPHLVLCTTTTWPVMRHQFLLINPAWPYPTRSWLVLIHTLPPLVKSWMLNLFSLLLRTSLTVPPRLLIKFFWCSTTLLILKILIYLFIFWS